jgi:Chitobiase/beta-hexosaminidase C-terminal domain
MRRSFPILVTAAVVVAACSGSSGGGTPTAATPSFTPPGGTYTAAQSVVISTTTPGATIHYTTDGSTPTTGSTVYTAAVTVASSGTLKATATASGYTTSAVGTASYTIDPAATQAATPVITPGTGSYTSAQPVTITCSTPGSTIHYTTDGTTPTTGSTTYTGAFQVSTTTTVKAIATATGHAASPMATAILTINTSAADFATFCAGLEADLAALQVSCYRANPDAVAADEGIPCDGMAMDIQAGRIVYDATHAAECQAAVTGGGCTGLDQGGEPAACRLALVGQVANGSTCYDGAACPNGHCSAMAGACPGLCVPYATAGQACTGGDQCATGLACDSSSSTCKTPSSAGGACPCLAGLYCDTITTTCAARKTSGSCSGVTWDECAVGFTCTGYPTTTCKPLVGLGGACSSTDAVCGWGYHCGASNACVADPKVGEDCTSGQGCIGGYCDVGTSRCVADVGGGTCSAAPSVAGLTLYDAFTAAALDGTKWQGGSSSRGVSGGAAVLGVEVTSMRARSVRNDQYTSLVNVPASATNRVTTLQADVTVPAATAARTGGGVIRAAVRQLYSPPGQRLLFPGANRDLIVTEVGLLDDGTGLKAYRQFSHCDDASCATYSASGIAVVDPPSFADLNIGQRGAAAAYGTPYTVTISLDETTRIFHWTIAGGAFGASGVTGTADPAAYLAASPNWTGVPIDGAGFQVAQIGVRAADLGTGGASVRITGRFDNVLVGRNNGAPAAHDDFGGTGSNSGPDDLSPARWATPGTTTVGPSGGSLVIHHHLSAAAAGNTVTGGTVSFGLPVGDPATVNALQADVAFEDFATTGTSGNSTAGLYGRFFNDGAGSRVGDATGDIQASVGLQAATDQASWSIFRCTTATCSTTLVGSGTLPGLGYNAGGHRLLLRWDPATRLFTFGVDGNLVTVNPTISGAGGVTTPVTFVGPAYAPVKNVNGSAFLTTDTLGTTTSVDIRFSDIFTGP